MAEKSFWLLLTPVIVIITCGIIIPLALLLYWAFFSYSSAHIFDNFNKVLHENIFWLSCKNSFFFSILSVLTHVIVGLLAAHALNSRTLARYKLRGLTRTVVLLPYLFSGPATGLLWTLIYYPGGLLDYCVRSVLGISIPWLGSSFWVWPSLILANTWWCTPIYALFLLAGLQSIPETVYEAAKVDGASGWQSFFFITLPQLLPFLFIIILIDFITSLVHFDLVWVMTRGGPLRATYLVSFFIYEWGIRRFDLGVASSASLILVSIVLCFLSIYIVIIIKSNYAR